MNTVKKIAKNTIFLFVAEIISKICLFLLVMFIARKLGDVELGKYSFAISFGFLFTILANFGLDELIIRNVAREKEKVSKYINNISVIKFFLSLIAFFFLVLIINLLKYPSDIKILVYIFGLSLILDTFASAFRSIFYAFEQMEYEAFLRFMENALVLILSLIFIFKGYGIFQVSLVFLSVSLINILLSILIVYKKFTKIRFEFNINFWKFLFKNSWPFALVWVFWSIYLKITIIMLSFFKGDSVVGWYSASSQILEGLGFIPIVFVSAIFPVMSRLFITDKTGLRITIEKSFKYLLILALPISVGIFLLSERFILLFFGNEFYNSIIILKILAVALLFMFILRPFSRTLIVINKQKLNASIVFSIMILNIILNLILIPIFSYVGAAITILICEMVFFFSTYYYAAKHEYRVPLKITIKPILAAFIMGLFVFFFYNMNLFIIIIISAIIYFLTSYLLKTFDREDIRIFKNIIIK